jgi:hypothetical protein
MGRDFSDSRRRLHQNLDQLRAERDNIGGQLDETRRQLDSVIQDRARISTERDSLQLKVTELGLKSKKSDEPIGDAENHLRKVNEELLDRIRVQDEQLKGKRALWMDSNPNSASRRRAMSAIQDPFSSPTPSQAPGLDGGVMGGADWPPLPTPFPPHPQATEQGTPSNGPDVASKSWSAYGPAPRMKFPSAQSGPSGYSGPPSRSFPPGPSGTSNSPNPSHKMGRRRRPSTQVNNSMPGNGSLHSSDAPSTLRRSNTEPNGSSGAAQLNGDDDPSAEFKATISKVYRLMQSWVKEHASQPDIEKDQALVQEKEDLWGYMMNCTFPGAHKQDAHAHVVSLMGERYTRTWFIMRLALTYCIQDIMSVDTFKAFSPKVSEAVEDAKNQLQERGKTPRTHTHSHCMSY